MAEKGSRGKKRLTARQEAFARRVALGDDATLVGAMESAGYSVEGSAGTLRNEASRLARHPYIAPAIEAHRAAVTAHEVRQPAGGKAYVLRRLREEADDPDSPPNARIQALALLARASGALEDASDREAKRYGATEEELMSELAARLDAYVEEPLDVTPAPASAAVEDSPED